MITSRRHDLDWLRVIAFGILIYFHSAIIFVPGGLPLIQNDETSPLLQGFVEFSHLWRLSLLFLISGVGVFFARRRRTSWEFVRERSRRLLIPLGMGILLLVPPMVYVERLHLGTFDGDLISFYATLLTTGVYPEGNLSWHHLWFIVYLFLYCMIGLWLFPRLTLPWLARHFEGWAQRYGVFRFIVPLFIVELALRAFFPGLPNLITDWANFFHFLMVFTAGYVIAGNVSILDRIVALRSVALGIATAATMALFGLFYGEAGLDLDLTSRWLLINYVVFCFLKVTVVWSMLLACLGYAGRYLNRPSPWLHYLNEAVYPLFLLHLTVIAVLGYFVVTWDISLWAKYGLITTATVLIVMAFYQWLIRPSDAMRLVFGVKQKDAAELAADVSR